MAAELVQRLRQERRRRREVGAVADGRELVVASSQLALGRLVVGGEQLDHAWIHAQGGQHCG